MKIGIITHYYNSKNYGGNLQAYALCEYIKRYLGKDAEQIAYKRGGAHSVRYLLSKTRYLLKNYKNIRIISELKKRKKAIENFNLNTIQHSERVYTNKDITQTNDVYDIFITGSDQVWNPAAICSAYLLDFVSDRKSKVSYAASVAVDEISKQTAENFKRSLSGYKAISVRENEAVNIIQPLSDIKVECTVDPVLLLSQKDWENISEEYTIEGKYVFCYYLGGQAGHRELADKYAKQHNLKVVTLPHVAGAYLDCDKGFGDIKLYDISPGQFLFLIKNAECVFTDSFHATAFSIIYNKDFYVFERNNKQSMASRIRSLLEMFEMDDRFCDGKEKECLEYINELKKIDYTHDFDSFVQARSKSVEFLENSLKE